ncbi:Rv3235 family protein [Rhodococcoides yunnanense]|uniref:Rv3235 family protein n=1 Tax=Rhodococcoides yunnanense TaxID=278209 RepID=UPI000933EE2E|nr:Rv3235 family protein [Rhodococcus yunnanensis]
MPDSRHMFLTRARPSEPAPGQECSAAGPPCRLDLRAHGVRSAAASSGRARPFPRSLGSHPNTPTTPRGIGPYTRSDVSEDILRAADQSLRLLLEVLDGRRIARHLTTTCAPTVVEYVRTLVKTGPPGRRLGGASLRRLHATRATNSATEVFATYTRGQRVFAIAARIEYRSGLRQKRWTITSLKVL